MDPALIPSPESLEEFFEKEWGAKSFRAGGRGTCAILRGARAGKNVFIYSKRTTSRERKISTSSFERLEFRADAPTR